jgi:Domain of unknown function (DUF4157)
VPVRGIPALGPGASDLLDSALRSPGVAIDAPSRSYFEPRFGHDFSQVRIHADANAGTSARALDASAYTLGHDVVLDPAQYDPLSRGGRELLGHELAHVVQQRGGTGGSAADATELERQADHAAFSALRGSSMPRLSPAGTAVQRRVSIRDVGRGEQSGMGRLDEFIARLNMVSSGLTFRVEGGWLLAEPREGRALSEFDRQMQAFIGDAADIPMRMTNRHGLLGFRDAGGFHATGRVFLDAWQSGYVDVDDFLASSPTDFMTSLVHLLRERQRTHRYAQRIGTASLDDTSKEFTSVHRAGLEAELAVLQDYLQCPNLHFIDRDTRLLGNARGDRIQERERHEGGGIDAVRWVVVLHGTRKEISLEEYRELLERERAAGPVAC